MPELPEVETIRRCLLPKVAGKRIESLRVKRGSRLLRDTVSAAALKKSLQAETIESVGRRGKHLIFALSSGKFFVVHLGMTGAVYVTGKGQKSPPHTHLRFEFKDFSMVMVDARTFGRVLLVNSGELARHPALSKLGPEPLDPAFSSDILFAGLSNRKTSLKAALLDQKSVAGLGNIYVDEACFCAGVFQGRMACSLSREEAKKLWRCIRSVIRESLRQKGCTIRDYRWDAGRSGGFAKRLKVYGREGLACPRCKDAIKRTVVAGRGTFFCPSCQC